MRHEKPQTVHSSAQTEDESARLITTIILYFVSQNESRINLDSSFVRWQWTDRQLLQNICCPQFCAMHFCYVVVLALHSPMRHEWPKLSTNFIKNNNTKRNQSKFIKREFKIELNLPKSLEKNTKIAIYQDENMTSMHAANVIIIAVDTMSSRARFITC